MIHKVYRTEWIQIVRLLFSSVHLTHTLGFSSNRFLTTTETRSDISLFMDSVSPKFSWTKLSFILFFVFFCYLTVSSYFCVCLLANAVTIFFEINTVSFPHHFDNIPSLTLFYTLQSSIYPIGFFFDEMIFFIFVFALAFWLRWWFSLKLVPFYNSLLPLISFLCFLFFVRKCHQSKFKAKHRFIFKKKFVYNLFTYLPNKIKIPSIEISLKWLKFFCRLF